MDERQKQAVFLSWDGLEKKYDGREVLHGSFGSCLSGGRYALVGESGSGKTTFLRLLSGLETPDGGKILWQEMPRISMVFQEDRLCEAFTAEENIWLILRRGEVSTEAVRQALLEVLPSDCLGKPVGQLSGGQKRRVAIVRAMLAPGTNVLLLDEPFTGLDEETKIQVMAYVKRQQRGRLLLLATHDREEIAAMEVPEENVLCFS